jgi:hypothetical protein
MFVLSTFRPSSWLISVSLAEYVILLTGRELRGRLMGREIYKASDFELLAVNPNISAEHPPHQVEAHLLALVRSHLQHSSFLFSYELDLTRRLQVQWKTQEMDKDKALCELVRRQFGIRQFLSHHFRRSTIGFFGTRKSTPILQRLVSTII